MLTGELLEADLNVSSAYIGTVDGSIYVVFIFSKADTYFICDLKQDENAFGKKEGRRFIDDLG